MQDDLHASENPAKELICGGLYIAMQPRACHPCKMKHSPRFSAIVTQLCPDSGRHAKHLNGAPPIVQTGKEMA